MRDTTLDYPSAYIYEFMSSKSKGPAKTKEWESERTSFSLNGDLSMEWVVGMATQPSYIQLTVARSTTLFVHCMTTFL